MKVGALFAGYGGIELALHEVFGDAVQPAWFCEFDKAPSKILAHHWPDVPNFGDVTKVDWANVEPVDIITGGSPCQDLSHAGKRAGMKAGTRSGLWASMCDAIDIIRPRLVVWENVRGALSAEADSGLEQCPRCVGNPRNGGPVLRALGRVLGDLSDLGYDSWWYSVRASDAGAPHARTRVFVVASDARGVGPEWRQSARAPLLRPARCSARHREVWGAYAPAISRWEQVLGRPAPEPREQGQAARRLSASFAEWIMGLPSGWVTDVPDLTWSDQIKALGNGVVPQQAATALRAFLNDVSKEQAA